MKYATKFGKVAVVCGGFSVILANLKALTVCFNVGQICLDLRDNDLYLGQ